MGCLEQLVGAPCSCLPLLVSIRFFFLRQGGALLPLFEKKMRSVKVSGSFQL